MAYPPDAFFIGAEKCGTTMICDLIAQHDAIDLSTPRDSDYLTRNLERGEDWYRALFTSEPGKISIDVSLSYAAAPVVNPLGRNDAELTRLTGVPERIRQLNPNARFIYSVRDPVTRTYSSYWHAKRFGYESRPFLEALERQPTYLSISDYGAQLNLYLEHFDLEAFHFVVFEDMVKDPVATAQACLEFLGVPDPNRPLVFEKPRNQSFQYNSAGLLLRRLVGSGRAAESVIRTAKQFVPKSLVPGLKKAVTADVPPISGSERAYLADFFRERNRRFAALTGLSLAHWA